jgi:hypothetical protein
MTASRTCRFLSFVAAAALLVAWAPPARAGGGPTTTLVVVNADSPLSWKIANAYVALRHVPATHVCPIPGVPNLTVISVDDFRKRIWGPIAKFLDENHLHEEIDCIAYSADFPFGVNYDGDFKGVELGQLVGKFRVASLTGLTYLIREVEARSRSYLDLKVNQYFRWPNQEILPAHGFRHAQVWARERKPTLAAGDEDAERYYLSTMLCVTGMQGNSVPEIMAYLKAGAASDGTHPKGTVYLMDNPDVRSRTRRPQFADVTAALARAGGKARELEKGVDGQDGILPIHEDDIIGIVAGSASFHWEKTGSRMLPGAIAEHLTSFGGKLDGSGQTKLTAFLRAGAVGSSGTVAEPYAVPHKFPAASLHVAYREGASLAEAFYESISGPYQLLVVGDPLARPYATFAKVDLPEPDAAKPWSGSVKLKARIAAAKGHAIGSVEVWLDGQLLGETPPEKPFPLDTTTQPDGAHELTLVAVERGLLETRSPWTHEIEIRNGTRDVTMRAVRGPASLGEILHVGGRAPHAKTVVVMAGYRQVAEAKAWSTTWKADVDTRALGEGPTTLQVRATFEDGSVVLGPFVPVEVGPPDAPRAPRHRHHRTHHRHGHEAPAKAPARGRGGLQATVTDAGGHEQEFVVTNLSARGKKRFLQELRAHKVKGRPKRILLRGEMSVEKEGEYRLAINAAGDLVVRVGGAEVFAGKGLTWDRQAYAAVPLKAGWQALEIEYVPATDGDLSVWSGGPTVTAPLQGKALRH